MPINGWKKRNSSQKVLRQQILASHFPNSSKILKNIYNRKIINLSFYSKFARVKKMPFKIFQDYVKDLCNAKKMNMEEFVQKLNDCKQPGVSSATVIILSTPPLHLTYNFCLICLETTSYERNRTLNWHCEIYWCT